jgi:hypothetical protein
VAENFVASFNERFRNVLLKMELFHRAKVVQLLSEQWRMDGNSLTPFGRMIRASATRLLRCLWVNSSIEGPEGSVSSAGATPN